MKRIAIFLLLSSPVFLRAQNAKDSSTLDPLEVRATRVPANAPFAKTNISAAEIRARNLGQDLPFLLNAMPSVVVNSDAGNGIGYTGIRIRGTDATRINVTINGIPYNDAESQGTFFVNLPDLASSVGSIQVQRGVGSSTNGAAAFGASINVSTNEVHKQPYAEFNNSFGSFNSWKNTIRAGTGLLNNHFTVDLRLSRITSDGFIDRASTDLKAFYFSTAYLADKTSLRLNVFSGKEKTYQAWYGINEADLVNNRHVNYAGTEKPGAPYDNETDNYTQTHFQLFATRQFSKNIALSNSIFLVPGKGYYEQYKADQDYADYGLPDRVRGIDTVRSSDLVRQLWLDNDFYGDVVTLQYLQGRSRIDAGGSFTRYAGRHFGEVVWAREGMDQPTHRWYDLRANKTEAGVFGKWQRTLPDNMALFLDLQFRHVDYEINGFRDNPSLQVNNRYNFFNPKFGLSHKVKNWLSFASLSIANKEPNRDDFEAGATQQPKPEQLRDLELGTEYNLQNFHAGLTAYYMNYKDQLVLTGMINDVGAYTRTNIGRSWRAGIELEAKGKLKQWLALSGNLALSRNKVRNFTEFIDDYDNGNQKANFYRKSDIAFSPSILGALDLTVQPLQRLTLDLMSKYVGKQYLDNTSHDGRRLDAYCIQDIRLAYGLALRHVKEVNLILQVNNILDGKYEPNGYTYSYLSGGLLTTANSYFPMAGINWTFGVNVRL